jgi:glycosyltransferase involved in cell wall biosynthesis
MRVALFVHSFLPEVGGTQTYAAVLATGLVERGHKVTIYTPRLGPSPLLESRNDVVIRRFKVYPSYLALPHFTPSLLFTPVQADIIHAFWWMSFQAVAATAHHLVHGIPFVLSSQFLPERHPISAQTIGSMSLRYASRIIATSKYEKKHLERVVSQDRIVYIPIGIYKPDPSDIQYETEDALLSVGLNKRIDIIIRAMPSILENAPKTELWIVGKGKIERYQSLAKSLDILDQVRFFGALPPSELKKLMRRATLYVQCSKHENFGIALLEAALMGKPIVSTPVGIAPEIIINGQNGFLVRPSIEDVAKRILACLQDSKIHRQAKSYTSLLRKRFSIVQMTRRVEELYRKVISE